MEYQRDDSSHVQGRDQGRSQHDEQRRQRCGHGGLFERVKPYELEKIIGRQTRHLLKEDDAILLEDLDA